MKKTLIVTLDFFPSHGGVSRYWERLVECLPSDRFIILAPPLPRTALSEWSGGGTVIRRRMITRWLYPHWLPMVVVIWNICRRYRIERIIVAQVLPVGTAVSFVAGLCRIPYVVSTHGMDLLYAKKNRRKEKLCGKVLRRAERVIANSSTTGRMIESYGVPSSRIEYIYPAPGITPDILTRNNTSSERSRRVILTVSRLVARKGHEYVLRALPGVRVEMPDVQYVIIGEGPQRSILEQRARELGLEGQVRFLGFLSDEEIAQWYDVCTLFIMTPEEIEGDVEGFGIVYLEAGAFGKPVIGTRTGGVPEAVHDGVTGLLVEPRDVVGIQNAVLRILRNPALAERLGTAGRKRVKEEFSWKKQAEKLKYLLTL